VAVVAPGGGAAATSGLFVGISEFTVSVLVRFRRRVGLSRTRRSFVSEHHGAGAPVAVEDRDLPAVVRGEQPVPQRHVEPLSAEGRRSSMTATPASKV
jgi:hypothetical protein